MPTDQGLVCGVLYMTKVAQGMSTVNVRQVSTKVKCVTGQHLDDSVVSTRKLVLHEARCLPCNHYTLSIYAKICCIHEYDMRVWG